MCLLLSVKSETELHKNGHNNSALLFKYLQTSTHFPALMSLSKSMPSAPSSLALVW